MQLRYYITGGIGAIILCKSMHSMWHTWDSYMNFIQCPYMDKRTHTLCMDHPYRFRKASIYNMVNDVYHVMKNKSVMKTKTDLIAGILAKY